jgi:putative membrane protein
VHPIAIAAALVAAAVHVWFFAMESLWFKRSSVYRRFGLESEAQAAVVWPFAFNQGFYNLFLAIGAAGGVLLSFFGNDAAGRPLFGFACGSMVAAGVVLFRFNPRGATLQIVPPLVAIVAQLLLG